MQISRQFFRHDYQVSPNWKEANSSKLVELMNLFKAPDPGLPLFLPIGQRVMRDIERIIRVECQKRNFDELYLPLLLQTSLMKESNRFEIFDSEAFVVEKEQPQYMLAATNEEYFLDLIKRSKLDKAHLPLRVFQISDKFRRVLRPKGILRTRQFRMCEAMSFDCTERSLKQSAVLFEDIVDSVFDVLCLNPIRVTKNNEMYVEYFGLCADGEGHLVQTNDGFDYARFKGVDTKRAASLAMYMLYAPGSLGMESTSNWQANMRFGCYGFGIQKCLHAIVEAHRDECGVKFPKAVRPFDMSIATTGGNADEVILTAEKLYHNLREKGFRVLFDDRSSPSLRTKGALSDWYGAPLKIYVGPREIRHGAVTLKSRGSTGEEWTAKIIDVVDRSAQALNLYSEMEDT